MCYALSSQPPCEEGGSVPLREPQEPTETYSIQGGKEPGYLGPSSHRLPTRGARAPKWGRRRNGDAGSWNWADGRRRGKRARLCLLQADVSYNELAHLLRSLPFLKTN